MSITTAYDSYYPKSADITLEKTWNKLVQVFQTSAQHGNAINLPGYGPIKLVNSAGPTKGGTIVTTTLNGYPVSGHIVKLGNPDQYNGFEQKQLVMEFNVAGYGDYHVGYDNKEFKITYDLGVSGPDDNSPNREVSLWAYIAVENAGLLDRKPAKRGDPDNGLFLGPRFTATHAMREISENFFPKFEINNT